MPEQGPHNPERLQEHQHLWVHATNPKGPIQEHGVIPSVENIWEEIIIALLIHPNPTLSGMADDLYDQFREIYDQLAEVRE